MVQLSWVWLPWPPCSWPLCLIWWVEEATWVAERERGERKMRGGEEGRRDKREWSGKQEEVRGKRKERERGGEYVGMCKYKTVGWYRWLCVVHTYGRSTVCCMFYSAQTPCT